MDITVILVGLLVLAIFILPFYFVTHSKNTTANPKDTTHHAAAQELNHTKNKKQHTRG